MSWGALVQFRDCDIRVQQQNIVDRLVAEISNHVEKINDRYVRNQENKKVKQLLTLEGKKKVGQERRWGDVIILDSTINNIYIVIITQTLKHVLTKSVAGDGGGEAETVILGKLGTHLHGRLSILKDRTNEWGRGHYCECGLEIRR